MKVRPGLGLQLLQLLAHLDPQERVERRERLVQQQHLRVGDQRARQGDALLLPARELGRQPLGILLHVHALEHPLGLPPPLGLLDAAHVQAEGDVVDAGEMREQRVGLEHHRRAALRRRQVVDDLVADHHVAPADRLVAGDHPQRAGLAAARRAEQAAIAAVGDLEADVVDGARRAVELADAGELDAGHGLFPLLAPAWAPVVISKPDASGHCRRLPWLVGRACADAGHPSSPCSIMRHLAGGHAVGAGWLHLCFEDASDRRRISRASTVVYHEDVGQARPARREVTRR